MELFTKEDKARIRERIGKNPEFLEMIESSTADVRKKLYIQKTGLATWSHYFSCPICGSKLTFDYYCNEHFDCPRCGSVQTGEPYLGSWWEAILDKTTTAAKLLAIGYVGTDDADMLKLSKKILLGYSDNYKNYEVHGGIPYNNPGRFASQVLSDAHPIFELSIAYGLIKETFTEEERAHIENDLFRPAAEHQIKYLTPQIHNHEVIISTSIAAIGFAIDDESLVKYARDEKYGLKYQIDHAYLDDSLWFECSTGYHFYSLSWFINYEMLAKNTEYGLLRDGHYREKLYKALLFPKKIYIGDGKTPIFNDGGSGSIRGFGGVYEFPYTVFGTKELGDILSECYRDKERNTSVVALLWGGDSLPEDSEPLTKENYISDVGTHLALLHGTEDRYFVLKAMPYGGEHDHYDRLGISFDAFGAGLSPDLGTSSGYGSPLHYGYYKNTASHNTVVIDGENMAPCDTKVNEYRVNAPDDIYLDAETLPPEDYKMLDSFTIKQWSDEAYKGVRMRRVISWHDKYFIDVFSVKSENELRKEYTLRLNARLVSPREGRYVNGFSQKGAQKYIKNCYTTKLDGVAKLTYTGKANVDVYTEASGLELVFGEGPNNPADVNVAYLLERSSEKCPTFVNVIETHKGEGVIDSVRIERGDNSIKVSITEKNGKIRTLDVKL